ncbi:MFS transporter [Akkermansiaceae bacterium]|jgi:MFS family permease|nr:MFS transporter [Akkermansiaceae bacterium]MDA7868432.1 MFS transporter [bacterium]MDA7892318.1 MFS transporter [Akkermansiaceae bacterium]MDA7907986.1 MFS transporter [Akkermansiaceae bacterium]MDA7933735.1 MFS transporter [Akkermansiaceae bacterium]
MSDSDQVNRKRLLWAGFVAILAAGVGFGIRGGIFANWASDFGFSGADLGAIGGAGFTGFCFGIMIGGVIVDRIGYGKLVFVAFICHILSAFVAFAATEGQDKETAYQLLWWGMFIFAFANGTLEAVANPLVSTLFPENRTHYLNILHASWPLGMILGGMVGWFLGSGDSALGWKTQLAFYLIPTVIYGVMFMGQKFPKSEASEKGLKMGDMLKDVGLLGGFVVSFMLYLFFKGFLSPFFADDSSIPLVLALAIGLGTLFWIGKVTSFAIGHWLIFVLFITHGLVGAVELGTDGWMQNITGAILNEKEGKILFVITSLGMFLLRFCAHFIEEKLGLNPISLLFASAVIACMGLNAVSAIQSFGPAIGAVLLYSIGKTFFWPTMLAVVGDRFPATGAVAMSLMGGIGMMSAGLIGSAGLGYFKDRYAAEELESADKELYAEWKSEDGTSKFLAFDEVQAIDAKRLEEVKKLDADERSEAEQVVIDADIRGNRSTLKTDSLIPAAMAVIYLLLIFYFRASGGYKAVRIDEDHTLTKGDAAGTAES